MDPNATPDWQQIAYYAVPLLLTAISIAVTLIARHLQLTLEKLERIAENHESRLLLAETIIKLRNLDRLSA